MHLGAEAVAGAGIVPRVADMIFAHCNEDIATGSVEVYISFLEIYQEKLKDLLQRDQNRSSSARGLRIRETAKSGVWVEVCLCAHACMPFQEVVLTNG